MKWYPPALAIVVVAGAIGLARWQRASAHTKDETPAVVDEQDEAPAPAHTVPPPTTSDEPAEGPETAPPASDTSADFATLPDGSAVPPLPKDAPSQLKLGVALFRYKGAQGANSGTRSKKEALKLAEKALASDAERFSSIVEQGDPGSSSDIGWLGRNVLEPAVEYAVFTLDQDEMLDRPLDTPRGYWVVKRVR